MRWSVFQSKQPKGCPLCKRQSYTCHQQTWKCTDPFSFPLDVVSVHVHLSWWSGVFPGQWFSSKQCARFPHFFLSFHLAQKSPVADATSIPRPKAHGLHPRGFPFFDAPMFLSSRLAEVWGIPKPPVVPLCLALWRRAVFSKA